MIKKIWINNFRGIKKGGLSLSPLTILLGANNSGKTTILEAPFLAPNPFRLVPYIEGDIQRTSIEIIHSLHKTLDSKGYRFLLHNYITKKAEINFRVNDEELQLQFIERAQFIDVHIKGVRIGQLELDKSQIHPSKFNLIMKDVLLFSSNLLKLGYRYLEKNWASILNLGICRRVAKEASKLSNDRYSDITIEPFLGGELSLYAYFEDGRRIRFGDLGEGIQNYILARILYEVVNPNILLWDDLGVHFNPRMILRISDWFSDLLEEGKQIILTTHSIEVTRMLASLFDENEDQVRIYLISLEDGILKSKSLTLKNIEELLEAGVDMRMAETVL